MSRSLKGGRRGGLYTQGVSTLDDSMLRFAAAASDSEKQQIIDGLTDGDKQLLRTSTQFPNKEDGSPDDHEAVRVAAIQLLPAVGGRRKSKRRKTRRRKTRR